MALVNIDKAIKVASHALSCIPNGHPEMSHWLAKLGQSYAKRFRCLGELHDIGDAIEYTARAIALITHGHPQLPYWLGSLGMLYDDRFQRLRELDDNEKATKYTSCALALAPGDHPHLPNLHRSLGVPKSSRFQREGELDDINKAIEYALHLLNLTSDSHPELPYWLTKLGGFHVKRFQRSGELDDIEKAIENLSRALALTPDAHPDLPYRLERLGECYRTRSQHVDERGDIEKAIKFTYRAFTLTPDGDPYLAHQLTSLGLSHFNRFKSVGELDDIKKAIKYTSRALALTSRGHLDLPYRLNSLGMCLRDQFQRVGETKELTKAIKHTSRALALALDNDPDLPYQLSNLGECYSHRFQRLRELNDINKAVEYASRALALTPDAHPSLSARQFYLAKSRFLQFQSTSDPSIMQDSLDYFRRASRTGSLRDRFTHSLGWANLVSEHGYINCIEAYQTTIELLPQFVQLKEQYHNLVGLQNLPIKAASVAIRFSEYSLALEWLEHVRCIIWNHSLRLRLTLDQLQDSHPRLAALLQVAFKRLDNAFQEFSPALAAPEVPPCPRYRLVESYNNLLTEVRTLPGFESFLLPIKASYFLRATKNGPVAVVNCHEVHCSALLIIPGQDIIQHLPLPNFTEEKARKIRTEIQESLRHEGLRMRGIRISPRARNDMKDSLKILWDDIVKPILEFLGYKGNVPAEILPHITWCPTGAASFLPLHAAGDYEQPRSRAFDYVISSYTPTLTTLLASTPSTLSHASRILAVGQASTPGHAPLPGTVVELDYVKARLENEATYTQLVGDQATVVAVLDAMKEHDWVHLACHAHQDVNDPAKSGFFLHDGILTLATIAQKSFKDKGLAFLSGCQTATGDQMLPDEAVHLASGMLMAGYSSVIATMWSIRDEDAPLVADSVYAQLVEDGKLGNGEAGKALHHAVEKLRANVGEKRFELWVPYIHIGS